MSSTKGGRAPVSAGEMASAAREQFSALLASAKERLRFLDEARPDADGKCKCCGPGAMHEESAREVREDIAILGRLIENPDMRGVWATLASRAVGVAPFLGKDPSVLWWSIQHARRSFDAQRQVLTAGRAKPLTPARYREQMEELATGVDALAKKIRELAPAALVASGVDARRLHAKNLELRQKYGETLSEGDYLVSPHSPDLTQAREASWSDDGLDEYDRAELAGNFAWNRLSVDARLQWWASHAGGADLLDLLGRFAEDLRIDAAAPVEIKQPGRGEDAFHAFLLSRLFAHMEHWYGSPLDDVVAVVASAIEDRTLSRDDVRPYREVPGRNLRL